MRAAIPLLAAAALAAAGAAIFAGGRALAPAAPEASSAAVADGRRSKPVEVFKVEAPEPAWRPARAPIPDREPGAARMVAPTVVAPPEIDPDELEWVEPREPLSELALALPPEPKRPSNTVFRPLAVESAVVETVGGARIAIAGTVSLPPDETCEFEGRSWPCGMHARTAFRMWLRGRALACDVPPDPSGMTVTSACRLGEQDAGTWLVVNGWARAQLGGPYAQAEATARRTRKGIFGTPPDTADLPDVPDFTAATADQPVLEEEPAE